MWCVLRNVPAQGDSSSPAGAWVNGALHRRPTSLYHAFVYVLFLWNRGNEARSPVLGKYYLRAKQKESAEDKFAGTTAQMMFFDMAAASKLLS